MPRTERKKESGMTVTRLYRYPIIICFILALLLFSSTSGAYELMAGIGLGPGIRTDNFDRMDDLFISFGIHTSLLWGRDDEGQWAGGPAMFLLSDDFNNIGGGLGGAILLPVSKDYPFELTTGGFFRKDPDDEYAVGITTRLWWGWLKKNMQDIYSGSIGLFIESRVDVWGDNGRFFIIGIEFDGMTILGPLWM